MEPIKDPKFDVDKMIDKDSSYTFLTKEGSSIPFFIITSVIIIYNICRV